MSTSVVCPSCSYPLLYQVTHGKLQWFCSHCRQVFPYGVEVEDQGEPKERGDRKPPLARHSLGAIAPASASPASSPAFEPGATGVDLAAASTAAIAHPAVNPELERLKDDFLNTVSHELRTPLANIKMGLRLLEVLFQKNISLDTALAPNGRAQIMRYLSMMNESCDAEISLINDLLALQHLAAGTHPVLPITITLQNWIPQLVEVIQQQTRVAPERIQIDVPPWLPNVRTDLFMLGRILTELLTNAGKFSPPDSPITISVQPLNVPPTSAQATSAQPTTHAIQGANQVTNQGAIQIRVSNLGTEIPSHELARIFDTFYRIPCAAPWSHSGMGLGLALVKAMTQYLGGTIWAENRLGQTIVVLNLPNPQALDSDSDRNLLMGYVAYYLSRGQALRSPLGDRIEYTGRVYHYWGYHQDFLSFWHQLEARKDFPQLSIANASRCFAEFLNGSLEVRECARCGLPQTSTVGRIYGSPGCELCDLECPMATHTALARADTSNIRVLAVGTIPPGAKQWQEHYRLNGVNIVFASNPDAVTDTMLAAPVDAVLIHQALSEADANSWVKQLARQPALMTIPMIALSAHVRAGMPWLERSPTLEDYLIVPLSGDALLHHLRHITALQTSPPSAEPYWFPG